MFVATSHSTFIMLSAKIICQSIFLSRDIFITMLITYLCGGIHMYKLLHIANISFSRIYLCNKSNYVIHSYLKEGWENHRYSCQITRRNQNSLQELNKICSSGSNFVHFIFFVELYILYKISNIYEISRLSEYPHMYVRYEVLKEVPRLQTSEM